MTVRGLVVGMSAPTDDAFDDLKEKISNRLCIPQYEMRTWDSSMTINDIAAYGAALTLTEFLNAVDVHVIGTGEVHDGDPISVCSVHATNMVMEIGSHIPGVAGDLLHLIRKDMSSELDRIDDPEEKRKYKERAFRRLRKIISDLEKEFAD